MEDPIFGCDCATAFPGVGRRTLLSVLPQDLDCSVKRRLCVLDASRLDDPAQAALLQSLADRADRIIFVLNKAELAEEPQALLARALSLFRQQGLEAPELYLTCAAAARLFQRAIAGLSVESAAAFSAFYDRFGPGSETLPGLACTGKAIFCSGSLQLTKAQLQMALINTGVPLLEARLRELACGEAESALETPAAGLRTAAAVPAQGERPAAADGAAATARETEASVEKAPVESDSEASAALAAIQELAERADCAELLESAKAVNAGELAADCRDQALSVLHTAYLERARTELETLVSNLETLRLAELLELQERINHGPYPVQSRTPYVERVTNRIEQHQKQKLRELCAGVETAQSRELEEISERLAAEPCAEVLKTEFFTRIHERKNALDLEALDRVVEGAEQKSLKELQALSVTLQANNWNPEFVTAYRHRVELLKDAATFREVQQMLVNLNDMERRELIGLKEQLVQTALAPRFISTALTQIDQRLYRMDMLRLVAMNNDFDRLDYDGLDALRGQVMHSDVSALARKTYLKRLMERENAIVIETAAARGYLARQLADKHRLRIADFTFAAPSREYEARVAAFWSGSGKEDARDYPAFLLTSSNEFAMTGTRFYYKTDKGVEFLLLQDIQRFQYLKQKFSLNLQIVRADNTYLLTEARIGRSGADHTLDFLNECLLRWNEPGVETTRSAVPLMTERFELSQFTRPVEPVLPTPETAQTVLREQLIGKKLGEGLVPEGKEGRQKLGRMLQALELPERTPIVWYSLNSLLGSVKDGVALGPKALYCRQSKQATRVIPLDTIYQIRRTGSRQVTVTTLRNNSVSLNISGDLAEPLQDYVSAIQLGAFLHEAEGERL